MTIVISITLPSGEKLQKSFHEKRPIVIGRSSLCDLVVQSESLSRTHCQVDSNDKEIFITDLNSSNGVYINGERIEPNIKTKFNTFFQLALGPLDCSVTLDESLEIEEAPPTKPQSQARPHRDELTATKRTIQKPERHKSDQSKGHRSKKNDAAKSSVDFKKIIIILPVVLALIYYGTKEEETPGLETTSVVQPAQQADPTQPTVQAKSIAAKDDFASAASYLEKKGRKNLNDAKDIVQLIGLQEGEGVILEDGEVFIFINPARFLENPSLAEVTQIPEAQDIVTIYEVTKSSLIDELQSGKYSQIHILIQTPEGSVKKIYRLHARHFQAGSNSKVKIISETGNFLQHKDPQIYWKNVSPLIPSQVPRDL